MTVSPLEGTYLLFVNLNPVLDGIDIVQFMEERCGIAVDYVDWFGDNYKGYIRINLGTKPEIIENSIEKIIKEANNFNITEVLATRIRVAIFYYFDDQCVLKR